MGMVTAVAFAKHGRLHYADAEGHQHLQVGDRVVLDVSGASNGPERVVTVLWAPTFTPEEMPGLPRVLRAATDEDVRYADDRHRRAVRARTVAKRQIRELRLPMQVLAADHESADERVTIWFAAPHRVDFRQLLRSLSRELDSRVLLRQVSERERAKVVGGVGVCGRDLCCATFLDRFEPITLQMARDQQLGTDPLRISGACGRLMCCLRYEHPMYKDFTGRPPGGGDDAGCAHAGSCGSRTAHDAVHATPTAGA